MTDQQARAVASLVALAGLDDQPITMRAIINNNRK